MRWSNNFVKELSGEQPTHDEGLTGAYGSEQAGTQITGPVNSYLYQPNARAETCPI